MMEYILMLICMILIIYLIEDLKLKKYFMTNLLFFLSFKMMIKGMSIWSMIDLGMIYMNMACDNLSLNLMLLTLWIMGLMLLAFNSKVNMNMFLILMIILLLDLILFFSSMNLMMFYLFFEISIIPMYLMILGWGYSSDRYEAGMYMLIYTLIFSLPMLYVIFIYSIEFKTLNFDLMMMNSLMKEMNLIYYFMFSFIFLVKVPLFLIHGWLPKAHVEAPLVGSMFLAGVLLKMGGLGLMRLLKFNLLLTMKFNLIFIVLSLIGMMILSIQCLIQYDMKVLVAYSSVVHMGMVVCGLYTMNYWGWVGSLLMMIAHGLCSSGMFFVVNLNYEIFSSRSMLINKGMMNLMPSMSMLWFLICSCNMSAPLSLNLVGEIFLLNSLIFWCYWLMLVLILILFFSACYTLYLFSLTQHGMFSFSMLNLKIKDLMINYMIILLHWIPLNLMMFNLNYFIS